MVSQAKMSAGAGLAQSRTMVFRRQPDQGELAARIRAAQAYAKLDRADMARALSTTPSTLDRKLGKRNEASELTWDDAWAAAAATGLPYAFFAADLDGRLRDLVPDDVPLPADPDPTGAIQRARAIAERVARQQPGNQQAEPDTHPGEGEKETGA